MNVLKVDVAFGKLVDVCVMNMSGTVKSTMLVKSSSSCMKSVWQL